MSRPSTKAPHPRTVTSVDVALDLLTKLAPDPETIGQCPALPGVVLDRVIAQPIDRRGPQYQKQVRDYESMRADYFKALVAHPVGRTLALLSVGPEGVARMELGQSPHYTQQVQLPSFRPVRSVKATYNCHHVIPKSMGIAGGSSAINHPQNLVVTNTTRRGRDQSNNPHHFWHAIILHPQLEGAPSQPNPFYAIRPLFPFYPPIQNGFRDAATLRRQLDAWGSPPLPEIWEKRILAFSQATGHKSYRVPKEYHEITRAYGDLYAKQNQDNPQARSALAAKAAAITREWLPGDAYVNGQLLGAEHQPKFRLPVVESGLHGHLTNLVEPKPKTIKRARQVSAKSTMKV